MIARTLARKIAEQALEKKAKDVVVMDLRKLQAPADFFVVCSADSDTQVKAIADAIRDGLEEQGSSVWHSEGFQSLQWVLLDFVDVVAHVFHKDARSFYNLERLWSDASMQTVDDSPTGVKVHKTTPRKQKRQTKGKRVSKLAG
ncbi:MAG: ribosome silencing factor [Ignavibacteriae bacterium]|nr:ribosome silencing factor [Ignavibacteriota bacterium]